MLCHRTVQPLLSLDEYKVTETLVHEFKKDGGIGQKLQDYLVERAKNHENWVSIYNRKLYLLYYTYITCIRFFTAFRVVVKLRLFRI